MNKKLINGIQQIGVGVDNADKAFNWYASVMGADISVFEDNNEATYMAPYMGGRAHKKRAILAVNIQGGGGYEHWQYLERQPVALKEPLQIGDFGINIASIKSLDVEKTFKRFQKLGINLLSDIVTAPDQKRCFYLQDPWNNILQIKESSEWFMKGKSDVGGVFGGIIGVSDIEKSLKLYSDILEYDQVVYDYTDTFDDFKNLPNGTGRFRRILLTHSKERKGGFAPLFGKSYVELVQSVDSHMPKKIFAERYWGDIGFIHICFDIRHISSLMQECEEKGFPFKVRSSNSFDMGEANGSWGYLEDCDGTLIEIVETHKVPIMKKLNWYINLNKKDPHKPLPRWLIKAMQMKRVKVKSENI
jgi:catechol 2,3-dioxygenase-like lactoylglutathione lyase family enzyme